MKNKDILAVVVTCNRKELLKECLQALMQYNNDCDILVIDNASTDGTDKFMADQVKNNSHYNSGNINEKFLRYIQLKENTGGAGGFSRGIKEGVRMNYRYIWIMDDDTIVNNTTLPALKNAVSKTNGLFGYFSSDAVWIDGQPCKMNIQHYDGERFKDSYKLLDEGIIPIKSATFVSLFINREAVIDCGLPYKEYFIWGDDKEYTLRLSKKYACYSVRKSKVLHKMNSNNGSDIIRDDVARIDRYRYAYRNDFRTACINGAGKVFNYMVVFLRTIIRILQSDSPYKLKRIKIMIIGMFEGMFFKPHKEF